MANEPSIKVINTKIWVAENEGSFVPPVCNKLMYGDGQLKIMFVGGPNSRKDFHIEEGEELFYMVKGNMCLKVKEQGKPKDIIIKEGEVFLLPCHIPHSPQRFPNTIGMVIEREREKGEQDCLRYYCEDDTTTLFEKWFYCADLGKDLVPIVKSFFESEQYRTGIPIADTITDSPPFQLDKTTELASPFLLQKWVDENKDEIKEKGYKVMFQTKQTMIRVYGQGNYATNGDSETWLWQIEGTTYLSCNTMDKELSKSDVTLIPAGMKYSWKIESDGILMSVIMDPKRDLIS